MKFVFLVAFLLLITTRAFALVVTCERQGSAEFILLNQYPVAKNYIFHLDEQSMTASIFIGQDKLNWTWLHPLAHWTNNGTGEWLIEGKKYLSIDWTQKPFKDQCFVINPLARYRLSEPVLKLTVWSSVSYLFNPHIKMPCPLPLPPPPLEAHNYLCQ
jgi:hypothetical protein